MFRLEKGKDFKGGTPRALGFETQSQGCGTGKTLRW